MYLIYGKGKVGDAVASLCDLLTLSYEIHDDDDAPSTFDPYVAIIPSPGIPGTHPIYQSGKILSELDFAYRYLPEGFTAVAITGTDGKSTTAWIAYSILDKEYSLKKPVYLSGNFDIPFSATVREIIEKKQKKGIVVVEISSFMAHSLKEFSPDYTIFTNFQPDHLDWHRDIGEYFSAKWHIVERTKRLCILNQTLLPSIEQFHKVFPTEKIRLFGVYTPPSGKSSSPVIANRTDGESLWIAGRRKFRMSDTHFSGLHNALNLLAVCSLTQAMKICSKRTKKYLGGLHGLPHRLEFIGEYKGVRYIEDSKSTSCQSLRAALSAFDRPNVVLIAGGYDKGDPFDGLSESLSGLKYAILIGNTREIIAGKCKLAQVPFEFADSMKEAVEKASSHADAGDSVLLSPGCASFGMFQNYLDRANQFREAVKQFS